MPDFKGLPFDSDAKLRKKRYGRTGASGGTDVYKRQALNRSGAPSESDTLVDVPQEATTVLLYGIDVGKYDLAENTVEFGETIGQICGRYGVGPGLVDQTVSYTHLQSHWTKSPGFGAIGYSGQTDHCL